jgi:glucose-1-phosphate thymidylyltransferase
MKGIILAGGLGSRLHPLTKVTNKHLLPVHNKPMVFYPIETLVNAGIDDILIVTGGNNAGDFLRLLGNGRDFGLQHINYTYQEGEGGIAEALGLAEYFASGDRICVVLGDNIIEKNIIGAVESYKKQEAGAKILLKEVPDPQRFGVPVLDGEKVVRIEEKPKIPKSTYAVTGALRSGRARDNGCQQRLYREGRAHLGSARWVVDGCRHLRIAPQGHEPRGGNRSEQGGMILLSHECRGDILEECRAPVSHHIQAQQLEIVVTHRFVRGAGSRKIELGG